MIDKSVDSWSWDENTYIHKGGKARDSTQKQIFKKNKNLENNVSIRLLLTVVFYHCCPSSLHVPFEHSGQCYCLHGYLNPSPKKYNPDCSNDCIKCFLIYKKCTPSPATANDIQAVYEVKGCQRTFSTVTYCCPKCWQQSSGKEHCDNS